MARVRGRPKRVELAEERRLALLKEAKRLFAQHGYHNTPIRAITQGIGMADGLLYHYFPKGKQEMLQTIFQEGGTSVFSYVKQALSVNWYEKTLKEGLMQFCKIFQTACSMDLEWIIILVHERELLGKESKRLSMQVFEQFCHTIRDFLEHMQKIKRLKPMNLFLSTHLFMNTAASGVIMHYLLADSAFESEEYIERLVDFTIASWENYTFKEKEA